MSKIITITELLSMPPGGPNSPSYINGEFEAVVTDARTVQTKSGKTMHKAKLADPQNPNVTIAATAWGTDFTSKAGKVVHFSGKGITLTSYKDVNEVSIGDKTNVRVVGSHAPAAAQAAAPTASAPTGTRPATPGVIHGATVGMAINQAMAALLPNYAGADITKDSTFSRDLYTLASDIIRVSLHLEQGNLAPSPKDRAKANSQSAEADETAPEQAPPLPPLPPPPPPAPPRRIAPASDGFNVAIPPDGEDVPF
jgi:hypothetical protein